jgi:hypothetical protein
MLPKRVIIVFIQHGVITLVALRGFITSLRALTVFLQVVLFGSLTRYILSCIFITGVGNILVN